MLSKDRLVLATNNAHKAREIKAILSGRFSGIQTMAEAGLSMDVEETGATFVANAALKAVAVAKAAGCWALADDSGLCVDALKGAPGVYSARWSGLGDQGNNDKLLDEMAGKQDRAARYACAMALANPEGFVLMAEGFCEGAIGQQPKGQRGFGYDPLFVVREHGCAMAELPDEVKNSISHRKRALEALIARMGEMGLE